VRFSLPEPISYHLDGEPMGQEKDFELQVQHRALRMLYGGGHV
jgi:diacylglycerol kinase family enzyme